MIDAIVIGTGIFAFVAVMVGGLRCFARLERIKAAAEAREAEQDRAMARRQRYAGPRYSAHGREIE